MNTIIILGSLVSAVSILLAALIKVYKWIKKLDDKFDSYDATLQENSKLILKLMLFSESIDMVDRLHAGEEYMARGGNGDGKLKYEHLLEKREQEIYGGNTK